MYFEVMMRFMPMGLRYDKSGLSVHVNRAGCSDTYINVCVYSWIDRWIDG